MGRLSAVLILIGLATVPIAAQGRGRNGVGAQGVPPGQLPPPGACRVWYDNRPPGQQPRPTNCNDAERLASRDRNARVIYGDRTIQNDGRYYPTYPTAPTPYPGARPPSSSRYPGGGYGYGSVSFDNGYRDGVDKGREDARGDRSYDPNRHSRYRSADHGYNSRLGSKDQYKNVYRDGFRSGYDEGYRENYSYGRERNSSRLPWPF